ncbi:thiamine phosphate synthase [Acidaminococcus intestini]|nr:thiamine phosphate synthase [Acidaminococcus intestini]
MYQKGCSPSWRTQFSYERVLSLRPCDGPHDLSRALDSLSKKRIPDLSPFPSALILREKDLSKEAYEDLFKETAHLCKAWKLPLLAHNHPDLALDDAIAGVHMPLRSWTAWSKMHPQEAGCLLEKGKTKLPYPHGVGISIHFLSEVETALQSGASYLIVSPSFRPPANPTIFPSD